MIHIPALALLLSGLAAPAAAQTLPYDPPGPVPVPSPVQAAAPAPPAAFVVPDGVSTVYDVIAAQPRHQMLAAAIRAAGLQPVLDSGDVYTVFAPDDAALAALDPAMTPRIAAILRYHVVPGYMAGSELVRQLKMVGGRGSLRTVAGELLIVSLNTMGQITVSDRDGPPFAITMFDQQGFNGIVHSVAGVAVPPASPSAGRRRR